ncbi:hypothetical protein P7K49_008857 [Saguinus oedipus]|uniref:Uncharacterized protein n=1 Tax=Saguinus oedipus TaxID=9490 RepID=A0ABQ9VZN3_SAGOE|nr:hypothetical protein P7K49_008857 [Saguinus oedipus]
MLKDSQQAEAHSLLLLHAALCAQVVALVNHGTVDHGNALVMCSVLWSKDELSPSWRRSSLLCSSVIYRRSSSEALGEHKCLFLQPVMCPQWVRDVRVNSQTQDEWIFPPEKYLYLVNRIL